jgi:hypothetical protein
MKMKCFTLALLCLLLFGCGPTHLQITSDPSGAEIYFGPSENKLKRARAGALTPYSHSDFGFLGKGFIQVRKEGYYNSDLKYCPGGPIAFKVHFTLTPKNTTATLLSPPRTELSKVTPPAQKEPAGEVAACPQDGHGESAYPDGSKYVGEWKNCKPHGQGTFTFADGREYIGQWKNGYRNGHGIETFSGGQKYVGGWKNGRADGPGTLTYPDGFKYKGEFKDGDFHGLGTVTWPEGHEYVGWWLEGNRNGQGTMTWADGSKYVGEWKNDKHDGQGTYIWADGTKYVGEFKDGKFNGQGTFTWADGSNYIGYFRDGRSESGVYTSKDAIEYTGKLHFAARIVEVAERTQAERIGLILGDTIVEYNGMPLISGSSELSDMVTKTDPTKQIKMKIIRHGVSKIIALRGGKIGISIDSYPYFTKTTNGKHVIVASRERRPIEKKQIALGHHWAVIIGISKYKNSGRHSLTNLIFADDDAKAFARVLRNLGWSEGHMRLLVNEEATHRNIMIALESWLTKAGPDDQIVLFWAGHGFPDPEDPEKVYFACYDTEISIPATGYRMDRVRAALDEKSAKNVVIFADTCHAGKLITRGGRGISIMPKINQMRRENKIPKGWIFMVGADTDRKAIEHTSWTNGAFTHCLLSALSGKADGYLSSGNQDGIVTMGELRTYMNTVMPDETQKVIGAAKRPVITTSTGDPDIWNLTLQPR